MAMEAEAVVAEMVAVVVAVVKESLELMATVVEEEMARAMVAVATRAEDLEAREATAGMVATVAVAMERQAD